MLLSFRSVESRWYNPEMLQTGGSLFQQNCASCHGANAEGTLEWKKTDSNGNYPPPPLNGTAHAWHHDISVLKNTIQEGGVKLGGTMPPFKDKESTSDIEAVIAYFQSKWPDRLYQQWDTRNQGSNLPTIDIKTES
ncbi:MAG: cytochrome c [Gammaproteobacteria bacterium]|nr:cytochrome c [Gammaproteobacteria bacterium]